MTPPTPNSNTVLALRHLPARKQLLTASLAIGVLVLGACSRGSVRASHQSVMQASNPTVVQASHPLVVSDFTGTAPGVNTPWTETSFLDPGIMFGGWDLGAGAIGEATIDDALGFYVVNGATSSTLADALANDHYVSCSLSAAGSGTLELNGVLMEFSIQRQSWHAPRSYAVFTSVGGFTRGSELFTTTTTTSGDLSARDWQFFLPDAGYGSLAGQVEIRIYGFEGLYSGHETSLADFRLVAGVPSHTLSLGSGPGGSAWADPDQSNYQDGQQVLLQALPDPGFRFAGWSGDVSGLGSPRTLAMDADRTVQASFVPKPPPSMEVGTNLDGVVDWSTSWPFADVFKRARTWLTRNADGSGSWDSGLGSLVPVDASGWPTQVPFDTGGGAPPQMVHTILVTLDEAGTYTFFYEGVGTLRFGHSSGSSQFLPAPGGPQSHTFTAAQPAERAWFEIHATAAPDHLRNFQVVHADHLATYATQPFHPLYLQQLQSFGALRTMDWGRTNNSPLVSWSERTRPDHYTQARGEGVALEYAIEISNTASQDLWICIPHAADDDYVIRAARLLRDTLDPGLEVWVEYSNETWNGIFSQTRYVQAEGVAMGLDPDPWQAGHMYVALRSAQIWGIFEEEFGAAAPARLVKVLATQSASIGVTELRVAALNDPGLNPDPVYPDVLALAPYFGRNYTPADIPPIAPLYPTVSEILDVIAQQEIEAQRQDVIAQTAVADTQGFRVVCYEGGQHFVGVQGAENDTTLTQILHDANRDPRMYARYVEYLDMLETEGVGTFANFSFCGAWSKWGSWGALEYMDQPLAEAPKYGALIDWIAN